MRAAASALIRSMDDACASNATRNAARAASSSTTARTNRGRNPAGKTRRITPHDRSRCRFESATPGEIRAPRGTTGYKERMKATLRKAAAWSIVLGFTLTWGACSRGTRADSHDERTRAPGTANEPKNTGDTRAKTLEDGQSPSASPTGLSQDAQPGRVPPEASGGSTSPTNQTQKESR